MRLDEECKPCLFNSQLKKVERERTDKTLFEKFKAGVKKLCDNPPESYCAPLLMRDIDLYHRKVFGCGIDYSREKSAFNNKLLGMEEQLYLEIISSSDPVAEALKFAMASNYIDFARLCDLNEGSVDLVLAAAERAEPDVSTFESFKEKLKTAKTLLYLHDNCGEIVLDKILIRVIKSIYPQISVTSVVRGKPVINDVTVYDAKEVGLYDVATVVDNGTDVPGTYLKEVAPEIINLLKTSDVIISKGLGNLETLYGEGFKIFYAFTCKCRHIAEAFKIPLWSAAFTQEKE